jgi:transcription antitermination factor NusG
MQQQWLVVRTRPQWERIVFKQLKSWYGMEGWCPLQQVKKKYTDRIKTVERPVFKSYVFVLVNNYEEYVMVLQLDGVVNFVKYLGKPAAISQQEMTALKEFIESYKKVKVINVMQGELVTIREGALKGYKGIVRQIHNNKVILELPTLGFTLEAEAEQIVA